MTQVMTNEKDGIPFSCSFTAKSVKKFSQPSKVGKSLCWRKKAKTDLRERWEKADMVCNKFSTCLLWKFPILQAACKMLSSLLQLLTWMLSIIYSALLKRHICFSWISQLSRYEMSNLSILSQSSIHISVMYFFPLTCLQLITTPVFRGQIHKSAIKCYFMLSELVTIERIVQGKRMYCIGIKLIQC